MQGNTIESHQRRRTRHRERAPDLVYAQFAVIHLRFL